MVSIPAPLGEGAVGLKGWRDYLSLLKLRIVALLVLIAGLTALVAQGGMPPWERLVLLLLAGGLASAGASLLNHYIDRDIDARMERTRTRPLPSGRIGHPEWVLAAGVGLILLSLPFSLSLNLQVALYTLLGAIVYALVYTLWLKRRTPLNIVIGGSAGSFAVLAGWAAIDLRLSPLPLVLAALVFLWTPLHFWNFAMVHRRDYQGAGIPMLPAVVGERKAARNLRWTSLVLWGVSLVPAIAGYTGGLYLVAALLLGSLLWGNLNPRPQTAWRNYKLSGIYLGGLFLALALDALV